MAVTDSQCHSNCSVSARVAVGILTPVLALLAFDASDADSEYTGPDLATIVGDDDRHRAEMICSLRASVQPGISGSDVAIALGSLTGLKRLEAIRCIEPRMHSALSGDEVVAIVGANADQRDSMLCAIRSRVRDGISSLEIAPSLAPLTGLHRLEAIRCFAPRLQSDLTGTDLSVLVGRDLDQRASMLCSVRKRVRKDISAAEVAAGLGSLEALDRLEALRCLEPQLQYQLGADGIVQLLGVGVSHRQDMICTIRRHLSTGISGSELAHVLGDLTQLHRLEAIRCIESSGDQAQARSQVPGPNLPSLPDAGQCGAGLDRALVGDYLCFSNNGLVVPVPGPACAISSAVSAPRTSFRPVYFGVACGSHDECYGSTGSRKSSCDSNFLALMQATCDETLDGDEWQRGRRSCSRTARVAFRAVDNHGCSAFQAAQRRVGNPNATCD